MLYEEVYSTSSMSFLLAMDRLGYYVGFIAQQERPNLLEVTVIGSSTLKKQRMISCQYVYQSFPNWYDLIVGV